MVEQQPSKLNTRVRFPLPAPGFQKTFVCARACLAERLRALQSDFRLNFLTESPFQMNPPAWRLLSSQFVQNVSCLFKYDELRQEYFNSCLLMIGWSTLLD